tara:strand:- start:378 stop:548 length:171 start_codon:yes stop_codon:yes gene_type:complete
MRKTRNKVCNQKIKRIVEEKYYPISFIERVNVMYQLNSQKKNNKSETNLSVSSNKS